MGTSVRRAAAFAAVAAVAIVTPVVGPLVVVPFALIAVIGRTMTDGVVFELFAGPRDRVAGQLHGLVGFALAATGLALLAALSGLPETVFVITVLIVGFGNLGEVVLRRVRSSTPVGVAGYIFGGGTAAAASLGAAALLVGTDVGAAIGFLIAVGALIAAFLRSAFARHVDPVVLVSVALALWPLSMLDTAVTMAELGLAVAVAGGIGLLSFFLGAGTVTGVLAGVIIALLAIVLGGYGWFAAFLAFAGLGALASKYRYEQKEAVGAAEANRGARSGKNVLGNTAVATVGVIGYAAAPQLGIDPRLFLFVFTGSLATAMADTLSSEIGVLAGDPRLITTLDIVDPGTDGGITVRGTLAGFGGALGMGLLGLALLDLGPVGLVVVTVAGVAGMVSDSVLGATLEGRWLGNQSVNFLATLAGALYGVTGAIAVGLIT